ncbi:MAG: hypothetical protein IJ766_03790 [Clostridia bacterium]|nr:hypothetical protein [Clostridia bacterium]
MTEQANFCRVSGVLVDMPTTTWTPSGERCIFSIQPDGERFHIPVIIDGERAVTVEGKIGVRVRKKRGMQIYENVIRCDHI